MKISNPSSRCRASTARIAWSSSSRRRWGDVRGRSAPGGARQDGGSCRSDRLGTAHSSVGTSWQGGRGDRGKARGASPQPFGRRCQGDSGPAAAGRGSLRRLHRCGRSGIVSRACRPVGFQPRLRPQGERMATSDSFPTRGAIPVGYGPEGIAVDGEARRGYVACARSGSVAVFDLDSREVVAQVPVGQEPIGLVHDKQGGHVFTTDARSDVVSVVDTATLKTVKQIPVQHYPAGAGLLSRAPQGLRGEHGRQHGERHRRRPARGHRDGAGQDRGGEPRLRPGPGPRLLRELRGRVDDGDRRPNERAHRRDQARLRALQDRRRRAARPRLRRQLPGQHRVRRGPGPPGGRRYPDRGAGAGGHGARACAATASTPPTGERDASA